MGDAVPVAPASSATGADDRVMVLKEQAKGLYESEGLSAREIARRLDLHHSRISRWAKVEEWHREGEQVDHIPTDAELDAARARAERASLRQRLVWTNRRVEEADAAGAHAAYARGRLKDAMDAENFQLIRANAIAYGILIDKAQLLSGGETSRQNVTLGDVPEVLDGPTPAEALEAVRKRALRLIQGEQAAES